MRSQRRSQVGFTSYFEATAAMTSGTFARFAQHLDAAWIEEALLATGTATLRRRRLPVERVVWLVLGMGLIRDLPLSELVSRLDLALPDGADRTIAPSAIPPARV